MNNHYFPLKLLYVIQYFHITLLKCRLQTVDIFCIELYREIELRLKRQRIIDGLGLVRLFFWFPERCFWALSVVHVVSVQNVNLMERAS